jgi:hypothetical protein
MTKTDLLRRGVPWLRLVLERRSGSTALNLGWTHRIGAAASLLVITGLVRRNFWFAGGALALLIALERRFYELLFRRRGPLLVAVGVPLHIVHLLTSAAAVPIALIAHLRANAEARPRRPWLGGVTPLLRPRKCETRRGRDLRGADEQSHFEALGKRMAQERCVEAPSFEWPALAASAAKAVRALSISELLS